MQQLLALPRNAAESAATQQRFLQQTQQIHQHQYNQQENKAHLQPLQIDQRLQMQHEAREHLKQQQQHHQMRNRQAHVQPQLMQDELLWAGMQNIAPTAPTAAASNLNSMLSAQQASVHDIGPSASGHSKFESSSPSKLSPVGKRSGTSSACLVS
jgi:hypothetical protein